jgi:DNA-directed RNA polymerase subunit RPC12/RpoP
MKLVDRNEALCCATGLFDTDAESAVCQTIGKRLKTLPFIEVDERNVRVYGHWEESGNAYKCSACGERWSKDIVDKNNVNFCPSCGAKNRVLLKEIY